MTTGSSTSSSINAIRGRDMEKKDFAIFLQFIKDHHPQCQAIQLTVHPENAYAKHLYTSAGFLPTGTELSDEPVYKLLFTSQER